MAPCRHALLQAKLSAKKWTTRADLTIYLESARACVEATPLNQITLDLLAKEVGISKYHLLRAFKEIYNTTPLRFATSQKLIQGKTLLQTLNVGDTASELGFEGPTSFGRAFRREFGLTPTEFSNLSRTALSDDSIE